MEVTSFLFSFGLFVAIGGEMIPCGDIIINSHTSICCDGRVYIRYGIEPSCCGMRAYDAFTHICCVEYVWPKMGENPTCCGNQLYDFKVHDCKAGKLAMKPDHEVGNNGGESPMLMKPESTFPPDDNYYIDGDYDDDKDEYLVEYPTEASGTGGVREIRNRPIVFKTRSQQATTEPPRYFTDLPVDFWKHTHGEADARDKEGSSVVPDNIIRTTRSPPLVQTLPAIRVTRQPATIFSTRHEKIYNFHDNVETDEESTDSYVRYPVGTGAGQTYPPLLPAKKTLPKEQHHETCCHKSGLTLYQCCLHTLNNSVNTILPVCCSGFMVKVCCWTGENNYSCCSRQKACCHPERLFRNMRSKGTDDSLGQSTNIKQKQTFVPVIQPQKTEVKKPRTSHRQCCRSVIRRTCCVTYRRIRCCRQRVAPSKVVPPWQSRVATTLPQTTTATTTTPQPTSTTTTPPQTTVITTQTTTASRRTTSQKSRNACCYVLSSRPTCCSTIVIRPYCCFRQYHRGYSRSRPTPSNKGKHRNCRCQKQRCCQSRRWPKRCCTKPVQSNPQHIQRTQEIQQKRNVVSCCESKDQSTCCWVLYVKTSRIPGCCENNLFFGANNQPQPRCDQRAYSPAKQMCCQGRIQDKRGVRPRCCGSVRYDAYLFYCCHGRISSSC